MTEVEEKIFSIMLNQVGAPYIWQGKGGYQWSPTGPVAWPLTAFDCSGLFGYGVAGAGLKDRRMLNSAQTWMDELEPYQAGIPLDVAVQARPVVTFYGKGATMGNVITPAHATHIALAVSLYGKIYVVEASGGDQTTTSEQEAKRRGARVRFGPLQRHDLIGYSKLPTT